MTNKEEDHDLLSLLTSTGEISKVVLPTLRSYARRWSLSSFHAVLETKIVSETRMADVLSQYLKLDRIHLLGPEDFDARVFDLISYKDARAFECLPTGFVGKNEETLNVVFANPTDTKSIEHIQKASGRKIKISVAARNDIVAAITEFYPPKKQLESVVKNC